MPTQNAQSSATGAIWPDLPSDAWADTMETLHLWSQIVGKVRMECSPWINHSWSVPLYVTSRGLSTSTISYGARSFEMLFDFIDHTLIIHSSDGRSQTVPLKSMSVATFYRTTLRALSELGIEVSIHPVPNELPDPTPFPDDETHATYDPGHAHAFWKALIQAHRVMTAFRARFIGKASPVHFFWGSFDLAVTFFSGRTAPEHPGGIPNLPDAVTREAYSHEVASFGFWPGNRDSPDPFFYSYAYPTPEGLSKADAGAGAVWSDELGEFILPYAAVREVADPDAAVISFFERVYGATADLADWNREALERPAGFRPLPARD